MGIFLGNCLIIFIGPDQTLARSVGWGRNLVGISADRDETLLAAPYNDGTVLRACRAPRRLGGRRGSRSFCGRHDGPRFLPFGIFVLAYCQEFDKIEAMLKDAILSTLAYYDVLDIPLTVQEIERYLIKQPNTDILKFLRIPEYCDELIKEKKVGLREGRYYLFDREYLVPLKHERERLAKRKWERTYHIMRWLRAVPFIRITFASGSLSMNNTDEQSDLDIIIVARHGHIWLARLFTLLILAILGARRRHSDTVAPDKMCPNHFITDESLAIPFRSLYTAQLYANLLPVIVTDQRLLEEFESANQWVKDYLYQWHMSRSGIFEPGLSSSVRLAGERLFARKFGDWLERRAAMWQRRRIATRQLAIRPGGHLTYTDESLAFHSGSSAAEILQKYEDYKKKLSKGVDGRDP